VGHKDRASEFVRGLKNVYQSKMIKTDSLFYSGRSMAGTFIGCDRVKVEKNKINEIKIGDVVVFISACEGEKETHFVHRVVSFVDKSLITRGDNNPKQDEEPVTEENLIGKVTHYERNGEIHKVWNGRLGLLRARVLHTRLHVIQTAKFFLRKPYRMIKKTGTVAKLWRPKIETIYFETQDGPLVKYTHKGRTVASCWTETNQWWFRRPYDFIIRPKLKSRKQS
jgi:signal peptidase I